MTGEAYSLHGGQEVERKARKGVLVHLFIYFIGFLYLYLPTHIPSNPPTLGEKSLEGKWSVGLFLDYFLLITGVEFLKASPSAAGTNHTLAKAQALTWAQGTLYLAAVDNPKQPQIPCLGLKQIYSYNITGCLKKPKFLFQGWDPKSQ